jgi:hypothetical protein
MPNLIKEHLNGLLKHLSKDESLQPYVTRDKVESDDYAYMNVLADMKLPPLPGQVLHEISAHKAMKDKGSSLYIWEQGTGKTHAMASSANLIRYDKLQKNPNAGTKVMVIADGGKLVPKMAKFAKDSTKNVYVKQINATKDIYAMCKYKPKAGEIAYFILSIDSGKADFPTRDCKEGDSCSGCGRTFFKRPNKGELEDMQTREQNSKKSTVFALKCFVTKNKTCSRCGEPAIFSNVRNTVNENGINVFNGRAILSLEQSSKRKPGKLPFGKIVRKFAGYKKMFDLIVIDEAQNIRGESLRTQMVRDLMDVSQYKILLSATLSNGKAQSLYNILYTINPSRFKNMGYSMDLGGREKFVKTYGKLKGLRNNKTGGVSISEAGGISQSVIGHFMMGTSSWLTMDKLNFKMPTYKETAIVVEQEPELGDAISEYFYDMKKNAERLNIKMRNRQVLMPSIYMANNPFKDYQYSKEIMQVEEETGYEIYNEVVLAEFRNPFDESYITNKESKLLDIVSKEREEGRDIMIYTTFSSTGVNERLNKILNDRFEDSDTKISQLSNKLPTKSRQKWIEDNHKDGNNVLITGYKQVKTGLDIPQYPTIIFYDFDYDIIGLDQAARRSWRAVVQKQNVKVIFMAYKGVQSSMLSMVSRKIAAAQAIKGKAASSDGIESFSMSDMELALIKEITEKSDAAMTPDFAMREVPEGRLRPWTNFEQQYLELLKDINYESLKVVSPEDYEEPEVENTDENSLTYCDGTDDEFYESLFDDNGFFDEDGVELIAPSEVVKEADDSVYARTAEDGTLF